MAPLTPNQIKLAYPTSSNEPAAKSDTNKSSDLYGSRRNSVPVSPTSFLEPRGTANNAAVAMRELGKGKRNLVLTMTRNVGNKTITTVRTVREQQKIFQQRFFLHQAKAVKQIKLQVSQSYIHNLQNSSYLENRIIFFSFIRSMRNTWKRSESNK